MHLGSACYTAPSVTKRQPNYPSIFNKKWTILSYSPPVIFSSSPRRRKFLFAALPACAVQMAASSLHAAHASHKSVGSLMQLPWRFALLDQLYCISERSRTRSPFVHVASIMFPEISLAEKSRAMLAATFTKGQNDFAGSRPVLG
jgi:hypothetical protein